MPQSKRIAHDVLRGAGDRNLGEWEGVQGARDIWHVQRRLTEEERVLGGVPEPLDIRGTALEKQRISQVLNEAPYLLGARDPFRGA